MATLSADKHSILIEGGKVDGGGDKSLVENIDDWRLDLRDWRWERLTLRPWQRWVARRQDRGRNHLYGYQRAVWGKANPELEKAIRERTEVDGFQIPTLDEELGMIPDLDLFGQLYSPPIVHEKLAPSEDDFGVQRIKIDGVVVRYDDDMDSIRLTVEGQLPMAILKLLTDDFINKLASLENAPCELIPV